MRYRSILIAAGLMAPIVVWAVSKDFNGRMWLAQVPAVPTDANVAYQQWIDDGNGVLKPGEAFANVDQGIKNVIADQAQAKMASQGDQAQQQAASAQQMMAKYGTPEGQQALKNMTPDQLMALAQQMQPQGMARTVSPHDQQLLQKIGNGVYSGKQQVMADYLKLQTQLNALESSWDNDVAALQPQEQAQMRQLPTCGGEASIPSSQDMRDLELKFADQRIKIASQYLQQVPPIVDKLRVTVLPEIDFGDDALAAWTQISDPGLKQQVSASAQGAEQQSLGDVTIVEQMVEGVSSRAAQTVADKKKIEKKYANAGGC